MERDRVGHEPDDGPCEANPAQIEITSPNATSSLTQPWNNGPVCGQGEINTVPVVAGAPPQVAEPRSMIVDRPGRGPRAPGRR